MFEDIAGLTDRMIYICTRVEEYLISQNAIICHYTYCYSNTNSYWIVDCVSWINDVSWILYFAQPYSS